MPEVSPQLQAARQTVLNRLQTMRGWIETADVEAVAATTGLSVGTVHQVKKGAKWNGAAVELLIIAASNRKEYYEKLGGLPLDEQTGKPFPAPQFDELPEKPTDHRPPNRKSRSARPKSK